jgi:hypothetical protein
VTFRCGAASGEHVIALEGTVTDVMKSIPW